MQRRSWCAIDDLDAFRFQISRERREVVQKHAIARPHRQCWRVLAEPVRTVHVVAKQNDPLGVKVVSQVDRLIARVRPVVNHLRIARQAGVALALNPVQAILLRCWLIARPTLARELVLYVTGVHIPPAAIAGIQPIGPWSQSIVVVDDQHASLAATVIHVPLRQACTGGNADDGVRLRMGHATNTVMR